MEIPKEEKSKLKLKTVKTAPKMARE